jgi:hypothetical protein
MTITSNKDSNAIKKMVGVYNMVPNLFWSVLNLIPVSVFCYNFMHVKLFCIILTISLLTMLLPKSFFKKIQLAKTPTVYKKIGVNFINKFTQNGDIINRLIRNKFPQYKVISARRISIDKLIKQTYIFEKFHFVMFVFFSLAAIYAWLDHYITWVLIILLTNLVYNIYPAFLQQYIRVKLTSPGGRNHDPSKTLTG